MTTEDFITELCRQAGEEPKDVFIRGRKEGWLEAEDELFADRDITRKNAARILHMYLLKVRGISDISGIEKAHVLRDLFDCRMCANHVAQMYLRGIMDARDLMPSEGFMWFDLDGIDDRDANVEHIRKMLDQNLNPL